ncbi:MAG TPA: hypothetical protein VMU51_07090 [Mycobacteriales bacterium]|nr:hypothetical protein [Mycobacteriales bacterium]
MRTHNAQRPSAGDDVSLDELARQQGVGPVRSVHDMARPHIFESDEELDEFLAHVSASRHANLA